MLILGIETSCDETSVAVVEVDAEGGGRSSAARGNRPPRQDGTYFRVLSNIISSQIALHRLTGGVVPEVAAREHAVKIFPVIDRALSEAGQSLGRGGALGRGGGRALGRGGPLPFEAIDAIAVTERPGLISSLLVGTNAANTLALLGGKTLIPVNHIEGHIYANWLDREDDVAFPVVILTVSGGHNELVLMREHASFESLGSTRDDAAGEAFDKVARLLGLPYPGGPEIARLAAGERWPVEGGGVGGGAGDSGAAGDPAGYALPRPLMNEGYDFSFSGLKSAVLRLVEAEGAELRRADLAASFQEAVCDVLGAKLIRAAREFGAREVHLAGGVSANERLRTLVAERLATWCGGEGGTCYDAPRLRWPGKIVYCTDNAAMIAAAGYFQWRAHPETYKEWALVEASTRMGF